MNLKAKIMIVRITTIVLALVVIVLSIATFEKPVTANWLSIGSIFCVLLALYHESLVKVWKDKNDN